MTHIYAFFSFFNGMGGDVVLVTGVPLRAYVARDVVSCILVPEPLKAQNVLDAIQCGVCDDGR